MAEPIMARKTKRSTRLIVALLLMGVLAPVCGCLSWWNQAPDFVWAMFRDAREYPHPNDPMHVTIGGGDLEKDLLPHYLVSLPCDVGNLRYGDAEDFGPMGQLYLRFEMTPTCLDSFLAANGLIPSAGGFPLSRVPDAYGWLLAPANFIYEAHPSARVQLTVSVDRRADTTTVFLLAEHY